MALALSAVMLTACGQSGGAKEEPATAVAGGAAEGTETTKPTGEISYKTELNVAITANPPSLDVHGVNSNIVGGIGTHIYEPLFAMDADYKPAGVLADSYTISEDGKVYTIKLRQGVKFHNGQEMTADDVVASMSRWLELSGKAKALLAGTVFEKADDYTITMTLPEAYADALTVVERPFSSLRFIRSPLLILQEQRALRNTLAQVPISWTSGSRTSTFIWSGMRTMRSRPESLPVSQVKNWQLLRIFTSAW